MTTSQSCVKYQAMTTLSQHRGYETGYAIQLLVVSIFKQIEVTRLKMNRSARVSAMMVETYEKNLNVNVKQK